MRVNGIKALIAMGAAAMLAGCDAPEGGYTLRSSQADLPTLVSLNPCLDALVVELAEPKQILALSHHSRDPVSSSVGTQRAAAYGVTGGTAEEVIALEPDLVLASTFIAPATKNALERAGLRVETFGSPTSVSDSVAQIETLAALVEGEEAGKGLSARISAELPVTPQAAQRARPSALLWQPGQIVAGEASLVAEHLRWAGFSNYSAERGLGQADHVSLERLVADPPDLLLVAGDAPGQSHPLLAKMPQTYVARFEPNLFYCAGSSILSARARLLRIRGAMEVAAP